MMANTSIETKPAPFGENQNAGSFKQRAPMQRKPMVDRLIEIGKWLMTPPPELPQKESSEDWYTGLVVDPNQFSSQLIKLQDSLHRAGQTCQQVPAETVSVTARAS